jgi:hypothetical protein
MVGLTLMKPVNEIQPATPANGKEVPTAIMLQAKMAPRWAAIMISDTSPLFLHHLHCA